MSEISKPLFFDSQKSIHSVKLFVAELLKRYPIFNMEGFDLFTLSTLCPNSFRLLHSWQLLKWQNKFIYFCWLAENENSQFLLKNQIYCDASIDSKPIETELRYFEFFIFLRKLRHQFSCFRFFFFNHCSRYCTNSSRGLWIAVEKHVDRHQSILC